MSIHSIKQSIGQEIKVLMGGQVHILGMHCILIQLRLVDPCILVHMFQIVELEYVLQLILNPIYLFQGKEQKKSHILLINISIQYQ